MPQSYKVFIGSSFIQFSNGSENGVVFNRKLTDPSVNELMEIIQELERESELKVIVSGKIDEAWDRFRSHFKVVEAAGGLVENQQGEWLFIHRNGMWDLPKGKLEKGESVEECAVREVAEECGIGEPSIVRSLSTTYHTYELKGKRILKPTYWYLMKSEDISELIPQTKEGITEVKWVSHKGAIELKKESFGSIKDVITQVIG